MVMPSCAHCVHYFITYERFQPYGCRAMGFKSRQNPAEVVFCSSGQQCRMFVDKRAKKQNTPPTGGKGGIIA
ncbi:uracil-DNA glycosylase [candidate division KSB3 bacterium]|uniref:Uracil-DNA glycosylase n=1 Tax=candidate division KSB3 bacterium TaxID=2044937 RepID=A0A2G6E1B9_9BACT|nr:MAG: uracil-DNA glycosylase [candidate division KSB3 bacterium]